MSEAIAAYRHVAASDEFIQKEKMRSKARHDEAQAIDNAEERGEERANARWQGVIAASIAVKDAAIADKDAAIANKDTIIAELRAQLRKDS